MTDISNAPSSRQLLELRVGGGQSHRWAWRVRPDCLCSYETGIFHSLLNRKRLRLVPAPNSASEPEAAPRRGCSTPKPLASFKTSPVRSGQSTVCNTWAESEPLRRYATSRPWAGKLHGHTMTGRRALNMFETSRSGRVVFFKRSETRPHGRAVPNR